ncbi:MAG: HDOD domain-containing protein, partial [Deltaproteobacteria bacterium]|nr:HDOD domain-containing protein [Deltaproteobacteria bacterium]
GFDSQALWLHNLTVAWIARELAEASFFMEAGAVMLAGLLHDLGFLLLATRLKEELEKILAQVNEETSFAQVEADLGLSHCAIGAVLAESWGLPDIHLAAVRDHHNPLTPGPCRNTTCMVALAEVLSHKLGYGLKEESPEFDYESALKASNLTQSRLKATYKMAAERLPALQDGWLTLMG